MTMQAVSMQSISISSRYQCVKRCVDIIFTLLIAPAVLLVGVIVALAILVESKGSVFYRQKRVGQNGVEFEMLKFRSMYVNSDDLTHRESIAKYINGEKLHSGASTGIAFKIVNQRRVTKVGRFIRKMSLDELPQFWNVLRGQMTLVGPRPPVPYEVELYSAYDWLRLSGKPGLTGTWQVYGRSRVPFHMMVEMDIAYLQQQSIRLDLKLIALTVPVMMLGRGGA